MALSNGDKQLLRETYRRLKDKALLPGDELYQPVYDDPDIDDPVARLRVQIGNHEFESFQLFSGFRGAGKTTELFRLRKELQDEGAVVLYADALNYVNPAEPLTPATLLMAVAGGLNDAVEETLGKDVTKESFWDRLTHYLKTTAVEVQEIGTSAKVKSPANDIIGGLEGGIDIKVALKESPSFRQQLELFLDNRLPKLKEQVNVFAEEIVKACQKKHGEDVRLVFIFDQLEQLRGSISTEMDVIQSVERIFASHINLLRFPYLHLVYSVPPWLRFRLPGAFSIEFVSCIQLWRNDEKRTPNEKGLALMLDLLQKRFTPIGFKRIFGEDEAEAKRRAEKIIAVCGGHIRDLMRLLRELIVRIQTQGQALPVSDDLINRAVSEVRSQFSTIAIEDAHWLSKIEAERSTALESIAPEDVGRLSRFLDTHLVLYFTNGSEWYDTHPLIRDEVNHLARTGLTKSS